MKSDVVVCGAGIAGVATAYHLAVKRGVSNVILVDPRPPLTLTSDKSTECYRNWWPNAPMVGLMNRSIDLLEEMARESGNAFHLSRQGYLYVTADADRLRQMAEEGISISTLGAGELRRHPGPSDYRSSEEPGLQDGADLFLDGDALRRFYPFLTGRAIGGIHARRAGWFSAQQLGAWMIDQALQHGLGIVKAAVSRRLRQRWDGDRHRSRRRPGDNNPIVRQCRRPDAGRGRTAARCQAPGLFRGPHQGGFPRPPPGHSPALTHGHLVRSPRTELVRGGSRSVCGRRAGPICWGLMPAACHYRPEGGPGSDWLVALWEYHRTIQEPTWPLPDDPLYPEAVMKGLTTMVPGLAVYLERLPQPVVDGGYYTKTRENRPLVGPLGVDGAFRRRGVFRLRGHGGRGRRGARCCLRDRGRAARLRTLPSPCPATTIRPTWPKSNRSRTPDRSSPGPLVRDSTVLVEVVPTGTPEDPGLVILEHQAKRVPGRIQKDPQALPGWNSALRAPSARTCLSPSSRSFTAKSMCACWGRSALGHTGG